VQELIDNTLVKKIRTNIVSLHFNS